MGGKTSKRVQQWFCTVPDSRSFRVSWPSLATCELTHIRVNMLQNPPISFQNVQQSRKGTSEKSERERPVPPGCTSPSLVLVWCESVMNSSMSRGPKRWPPQEQARACSKPLLRVWPLVVRRRTMIRSIRRSAWMRNMKEEYLCV